MMKFKEFTTLKINKLFISKNFNLAVEIDLFFLYQKKEKRNSLLIAYKVILLCLF